MTCVLFAPAIPEVETSRIHRVGTDLSLSFLLLLRPMRNFSTVTWPHGSFTEGRPGFGFYNELCETQPAFTG